MGFFLLKLSGIHMSRLEIQIFCCLESDKAVFSSSRNFFPDMHSDFVSNHSGKFEHVGQLILDLQEPCERN